MTMCKFLRNVERNLTTEDNPTYAVFHLMRQSIANQMAYRIATQPSR